MVFCGLQEVGGRKGPQIISLLRIHPHRKEKKERKEKGGKIQRERENRENEREVREERQ